MSKTYTATSPPRGDKAVGTEVKVPYENVLTRRGRNVVNTG